MYPVSSVNSKNTGNRTGSLLLATADSLAPITSEFTDERDCRPVRAGSLRTRLRFCWMVVITGALEFRVGHQYGRRLYASFGGGTQGRRSLRRSRQRGSLEDLLHVCIDCTGPAASSSVWRNLASRRVVDPAARRRSCGLSTFLVYSTWAAFQGDHYTYGPYLSPFYSPELFGNSPHSWFGPRPGNVAGVAALFTGAADSSHPRLLQADLLLLPRRVLQSVLGGPAVVHGR